MEIIQGMKNKQELVNFDKTLIQWDVTIYPITKAISYSAMELVKTYSLSYSLYLADALIAATAIHHQLPLFSANTKHYRMLEQLNLVTFKP